MSRLRCWAEVVTLWLRLQKQASLFGDYLNSQHFVGNLYIWGQAEYDQMYEFTDEPQLFKPMHARFDFNGQKVKSAAATNTSCIVATEDGHVFTWGSMFLGSGKHFLTSLLFFCF